MAPLLTVDDLAAVLQVKPRTVRAMCARGELGYMRVSGKFLRFSAADVDRYLAEHRRAPRS